MLGVLATVATTLAGAGTMVAAWPAAREAAAAAVSAESARVVEAAAAYSHATARLTTVTRALADVEWRLGLAQAALEETQRQLSEQQGALDGMLATLRARAALVYRRQGALGDAMFSVSDVRRVAAVNEYAKAAAAFDNREVDRLRGVVARLAGERVRQLAARDDLAARRADLAAQQAAAKAEADRVAAVFGTAGVVPLMGASLLTPEELAVWFRAAGLRARLSGGATIEDLAHIYAEEAAAEGVRADVAFAQAVLETGAFGHATDNNYAGIGACDSCDGQVRFPSPRAGVRAQVQMLRAFADSTATAATLANPPSPEVFGRNPDAADRAFDAVPYRGQAPLWNLMGNGNWATDPDYGAKVLTIYARMLTFYAPS